MVTKYIIDKTDIHRLLIGEDLALPQGCKARAFCVEISGKLTNGDMVKAMFPNARVSEIIPISNDDVYYVTVEKVDGITNEMRVMKSWWNAPYRKEG